MMQIIQLDLNEAIASKNGKIVGALSSVEAEWNTRRKQARENNLITAFFQYHESYNTPKATI